MKPASVERRVSGRTGFVPAIRAVPQVRADRRKAKVLVRGGRRSAVRCSHRGGSCAGISARSRYARTFRQKCPRQSARPRAAIESSRGHDREGSQRSAHQLGAGFLQDAAHHCGVLVEELRQLGAFLEAVLELVFLQIFLPGRRLRNAHEQVFVERHRIG